MEFYKLSESSSGSGKATSKYNGELEKPLGDYFRDIVFVLMHVFMIILVIAPLLLFRIFEQNGERQFTSLDTSTYGYFPS